MSHKRNIAIKDMHNDGVFEYVGFSLLGIFIIILFSLIILLGFSTVMNAILYIVTFHWLLKYIYKSRRKR